MALVNRLVDIFVRRETHKKSTLANGIEAEQDIEIDYGQTLGIVDLMHGRLGLACVYEYIFARTPLVVQERVSLRVQYLVGLSRVCHSILMSTERYHDSMVLPERSSHYANYCKERAGVDQYAHIFTRIVSVCLISISLMCDAFLDGGGST